MIKILSLQTGTDFGGTELMSYYKNVQINKDFFDISVCFLNNKGPVSDMYLKHGFKQVYHLNTNLLFSFFRLIVILKKNKYDIIHTSGLRISLIARLASIFFNNTKIIHSQNSVDSWRKSYHCWLDRITSGFVDKYICNSVIAKKILIDREKISSNKIKVIHNGIDITRFENIESSFRQKYSRNNEIIISCVANLRKAKNHFFLIKVCRKLKEKSSGFKFIFVGDGNLKLNIQKKIKENNLEDYIELLGKRSDIPEILAGTDIFLLGSLWEGLPGSILEAMASSIPVVSTNVGGVGELVIDNETGLLSNINDVNSMTEKLHYLIQNDEKRRFFGKKGKSRALKHFRIKDKVSDLEKIYTSIIKQ